MGNEVLTLLVKIPGHISPHELVTLNEYAEKVERGHVVEIGSFLGLSTMALALGVETKEKIRVYAIDPHDSYTDVSDVNPNYKQKYGSVDMSTFLENIVAQNAHYKIFPVALSSNEVVWERPIGLLFIDGAHDYYSVLDDFDSFHLNIVPGGYLIFHDSEWDGPKRVIKEIQEQYKHTYTLLEVVDALTIFRKNGAADD